MSWETWAARVTSWPWSMIAALISAVVLGLATWTQVLKPIRRARRLKKPAEAYFHIGSMREVRMDYVVQDDQGHSVKELVLPPNRTQYIEIQYLCNTHFHLDSVVFDCEGDPKEKPLAKERLNQFVAVGKKRWVPGEDDSDIIDRKGGYHIKVDRAKNVGTWTVIGFQLQTQRVGVYKANLSFIADEFEGNDTLIIRVEDAPTTKRLRCVVSHKDCYLRVIHPK